MPSQILNGAQLTLVALQESDQEAFQRLLGSLLKTGYDPTGFQHGPITADPDDAEYANAEVSVDRRKANIAYWAYQDSIPIRYRRIALEALKSRFGSVIRADLPVSKKELMAIYCASNGLYNRSDQIVDEMVMDLGATDLIIRDGQFLIYGQAAFEIKPFQRQLVDVIQLTTLNGFRTTDDFDSSAIELLFDQLSTGNQPSLPYPLESGLLTWGVPIKVGGYRYDNTSIEVEAFGDGYYLGKQTLIYTRFDFGWSTQGAQFLVDGPSTPTTTNMITSVSNQSGFPISLDDVVIESYDPVPSGELVTLTVFFKEESLRYTGELTIDYRAV